MFNLLSLPLLITSFVQKSVTPLPRSLWKCSSAQASRFPPVPNGMLGYGVLVLIFLLKEL